MVRRSTCAGAIFTEESRISPSRVILSLRVSEILPPRLGFHPRHCVASMGSDLAQTHSKEAIRLSQPKLQSSPRPIDRTWQRIVPLHPEEIGGMAQSRRRNSVPNTPNLASGADSSGARCFRHSRAVHTANLVLPKSKISPMSAAGSQTFRLFTRVRRPMIVPIVSPHLLISASVTPGFRSIETCSVGCSAGMLRQCAQWE